MDAPFPDTETRRPYTINEASALLGISRQYASRLIAAGKFPTPVVRIGSMTRVPRRPLDALLAGDPQEAGGDGRTEE